MRTPQRHKSRFIIVVIFVAAAALSFLFAHRDYSAVDASGRPSSVTSGGCEPASCPSDLGVRRFSDCALSRASPQRGYRPADSGDGLDVGLTTGPHSFLVARNSHGFHWFQYRAIRTLTRSVNTGEFGTHSLRGRLVVARPTKIRFG